MSIKREKKTLIIVVSIIVLIIMCLLTFITISVIENTRLYKREDGSNSISRNIANIDDIAYEVCGDERSKICKYEVLTKPKL